jgi:hypothetical protein
MTIFLDTASLTEIREAATLGVVDGWEKVKQHTTAKAGR